MLKHLTDSAGSLLDQGNDDVARHLIGLKVLVDAISTDAKRVLPAAATAARQELHLLAASMSEAFDGSVDDAYKSLLFGVGQLEFSASQKTQKAYTALKDDFRDMAQRLASQETAEHVGTWLSSAISSAADDLKANPTVYRLVLVLIVLLAVMAISILLSGTARFVDAMLRLASLLRGVSFVTAGSILAVGVLAVALVPYLSGLTWFEPSPPLPATACPTALPLITFDSKNGLQLEAEAVDFLAKQTGRGFVVSASGEIGSGKTTHTDMSVALLLGEKRGMAPACAHKYFMARTSAAQDMDQGNTRGAAGLVVFGHQMAPENPELRMALASAFSGGMKSDDFILFIDTQGTDDKRAMRGESEMIELLAHSVSDVHLFSTSNNPKRKGHLDGLLRIGNLDRMLRRLSGSSCGSVELGGNLVVNEAPAIIVRHMDAVLDPKLHRCYDIESIESTTIDGLAEGNKTCPLNTPLLLDNDPFLEQLSESERAVLIDIQRAEYFPQPAASRKELMAMRGLVQGEAQEFFTAAKENKTYGVVYSVNHLLLPHVVRRGQNRSLLQGKQLSTSLKNVFLVRLVRRKEGYRRHLFVSASQPPPLLVSITSP